MQQELDRMIASIQRNAELTTEEIEILSRSLSELGERFLVSMVEPDNDEVKSEIDLLQGTIKDLLLAKQINSAHVVRTFVHDVVAATLRVALGRLLPVA